MGKFWTKIEQFWNENRVLAWILPLSGLALGLWASFWPQSPGVSIGLLALAAGVMSIRPAMHPAEKTTWVIVLVAFAILEVHAIHIGDQKAQATIDEQKKAFSDIGEGIKNSITANKGQYDSTISHVDGVLKTTQGVADLASRNLESVTGGDSYGYVIPRYATNFQDMLPQSQIPRTLPIVLMNGGSQPLTGVTVMISRFELIKPIPGMAKGMRAILGQVLPPTIMGTLSANGTLLLPYQLDTDSRQQWFPPQLLYRGNRTKRS